MEVHQELLLQMVGMLIGNIDEELQNCFECIPNQSGLEAGVLKPKLFIMKKIFLLILIIISVAAIHSCQKEISGEPGNTPAGSEVDVYVAGSEVNSGGISVANTGKTGRLYHSPMVQGMPMHMPLPLRVAMYMWRDVNNPPPSVAFLLFLLPNTGKTGRV